MEEGEGRRGGGRREKEVGRRRGERGGGCGWRGWWQGRRFGKGGGGRRGIESR